MSRGQLLLSITALGVGIAVITVQVLLADHHDLIITAMRLGGASLLAISAALLATIEVPARKPAPMRVRSSATAARR